MPRDLPDTALCSLSQWSFRIQICRTVCWHLRTANAAQTNFPKSELDRIDCCGVLDDLWIKYTQCSRVLVADITL
jgi:hypothetical protein